MLANRYCQFGVFIEEAGEGPVQGLGPNTKPRKYHRQQGLSRGLAHSAPPPQFRVYLNVKVR